MRKTKHDYRFGAKVVRTALYTCEEFKKHFRVGDRLYMANYQRKDMIEVTAIGEHRILYRSLTAVAPEMSAAIGSSGFAHINTPQFSLPSSSVITKT